MIAHEQQEQEFSLKSYFVPFTTFKAIHFIILIGLIIFFLSLFNNFVGDDNTQIIDNPSIKSLQNVPEFFFVNRLDTGGQTKLGGEYYKPLLDTSYAVTYSVFGLNVFFYHFLQLTLFITNACLVFLLFKQFFDKRIAFFLSLIFLVHPINSETALYIADTQDVLFFFFGIVALLIIKKYQSQKALLLASFCILLSLFSKETGALFLLIILLYAFMEKRKIFVALFCYSSIIAIMYALLRIRALGLSPHGVINAPIERANFETRMINIPSMFFFYLKTFLFPIALSGSWQWVYTHIDVSHFVVPLAVDSLLLVLIIYFAIILQRKHSKKYFILYIFFSVWFLLGVAFHLQILPLDQTVADRWFYFPVVGILGMIGVLLKTIGFNVKNKWIIIGAAILIILLAVRTFIRTFDFKDDFTLASHDITVSKDSYNSEYIISHTYYEEGNLKEAKIHAERSIQLFPYITNYTNLGAIDSRMEDYKGAKEAYLKALQYGNDALPYENLSSLSLVYGDPKENISFIKNTALKKYPQDGIMWFDLAILEYAYGDKSQAKDAIKKAKLFIQNPNVNFVDYIIINNKSLNIKVTNGNVLFYTY